MKVPTQSGFPGGKTSKPLVQLAAAPRNRLPLGSVAVMSVHVKSDVIASKRPTQSAL